ncbi:MAG TPA: polysaccharide deacetylase family protein [Candidatus Polarisedimenticolaceae bacterium]
MTIVPILLGALSVAVTFDDLPCNPAEGATVERQNSINGAIVATLKERSIPAVGFVNESRLTDRAVLALWLDAGLDLGNHTFSHPDLHQVGAAKFLEDVVLGDRVTREMLEARGRSIRWFRHPFLHTGLDLDTKGLVETFLAARGLKVAPVTIDNSEWIFARAYLRADEAKDAAARGKIADAYVAYMEAKTDYCERQARALFGRDIPQVLLVHANRLNADHFGRIASMLAARGYTFVSLEAATADAAYASRDTYVGRGGITWLHRWALGSGRTDAVVPNEPETPAWILKAAGLDAE